MQNSSQSERPGRFREERARFSACEVGCVGEHSWKKKNTSAPGRLAVVGLEQIFLRNLTFLRFSWLLTSLWFYYRNISLLMQYTYFSFLKVLPVWMF